MFQPDCGYKMDRIEKLADRYDDMIEKMVSWTSRCKRFTGETCPSQCRLVDGECMMPKGKVNIFLLVAEIKSRVGIIVKALVVVPK